MEDVSRDWTKRKEKVKENVRRHEEDENRWIKNRGRSIERLNDEERKKRTTKN